MADLSERVLAELNNISKIVLEVKKLGLQESLNKHQINSAALYLHNFYNGIENILKQFAQEYNYKLTDKSKWHKDLLEKCLNEKIINSKLFKSLKEYLKFRHFVSHAYSFNYDYNLFKPLVLNLEKIYNNFYKIILKNLNP